MNTQVLIQVSIFEKKIQYKYIMLKRQVATSKVRVGTIATDPHIEYAQRPLVDLGRKRS